MWKFLTIFLNILILNTANIIYNKNLNGRILNGLNTEQNEFPFIVSVRYEGLFHHCGGSIITDRHILTAAHCLVNGNDPKNYTVYIGSNRLSNGIAKAVEAVKSHREYKGESDWWKHDLAILKLKEPLQLTDSVKTINISSIPVNDNDSLMIAGWGLTLKPSSQFPNVQQKLNTKAYNLEECKKLWYSVVEEQLCLWNGKGSMKGFCQGDSGGPVINSNHELVGVVSWTRSGCDQDKPDVAVKLAPNYLEWIKKSVETL